MWANVLYFLPLAVVVVANLGVKHRYWRILAYIGLAVLNAAALFFGLLFLSVPLLLRASRQPLSPSVQGMNIPALGLAFVVAAILGFACLLRPLRRQLSRLLPIDAASPVHTTAVTFLIYFVATSLGLLAFSPQLINISLGAAGLGMGAVVIGEVVLLLFALVGTGLGTRRNVRQTMERLGLRLPTWRQLALAAAAVIALLALDYLTALLWRQLWPGQYEAVMESSQRMLVGFASPLGAAVLGLSAGIGEETLFRGALQPRFRTPLTAAVFALSHVQYSLSPAILEIFIVGLVLGWLRERTNTTTCVAVHAGYNFLDMLIMPLLP